MVSVDDVLRRKVNIKLKYDIEYKPEYASMLLRHMAKGFSFYSFGGLIGVARKTLDIWLSAVAEFRMAREIGELMSLLFWESLSIKALKGESERFSKLFNSAVWIYSMKCRFPEFWTDRVLTKEERDITITFSDGSLVKDNAANVRLFYEHVVEETRKALPDLEHKDFEELSLDLRDIDVKEFFQTLKEHKNKTYANSATKA